MFGSVHRQLDVVRSKLIGSDLDRFPTLEFEGNESYPTIRFRSMIIRITWTTY